MARQVVRTQRDTRPQRVWSMTLVITILLQTVGRKHGRAIVSQLRRVHSEDIRLPGPGSFRRAVELTDYLRNAWWQEEGQDVAEYAVMLAVILAIAIGTIKLIGANASNVLADVGSAIQ